MLSSLLEGARKKIASAISVEDIESIRIEYLGKTGEFSKLLRQLSSMDDTEKKKFGQEINVAKEAVILEIATAKVNINDKLLQAKLTDERVDVTIPHEKKKVGSMHPITKSTYKFVELLGKFGFAMHTGPDIETDWYNFTALNIPDDHPAREMHDTFYVSKETGDTKMHGTEYVLRTHTSPVQIRAMESSDNPCLRILSTGRVYRSDYDHTHSPMFHQMEGLMIDKDVTMGHLKYILTYIIHEFFENTNIELRFRPSFFPFTEPSAEVDIKFPNQDKWLEVLGCGMVHPNVLKNVGIDHTQYNGFAFGLGIERMTMLKYGIKDLRQFFEGDIRWSEYYGKF